jgi:hypothetical protein
MCVNCRRYSEPACGGWKVTGVSHMWCFATLLVYIRRVVFEMRLSGEMVIILAHSRTLLENVGFCGQFNRTQPYLILHYSTLGRYFSARMDKGDG